MIPSSPARNEVEALVLAAADTDKTPALVTDGASTEGLDLQALAAALPAVGFTGALDAVVRLPADVLAVLDTEPIVLPAWDPMGSLA